MKFFPLAKSRQRALRGLLCMVVLLTAAASQTFGAAASYVHFGFTTNWPAIDATLFDNRGTFKDIQTTFPADMTDTKTFLNHGEMTGQVGFRFDLVTSTTRRAALAFTNFEGGVINGLDNPTAYWGFLIGSTATTPVSFTLTPT